MVFIGFLGFFFVGFSWFSSRFSMVFQWIVNGFLAGFSWFSRGLMVFHGFLVGFDDLLVSFSFFSWSSSWLSMA